MKLLQEEDSDAVFRWRDDSDHRREYEKVQTVRVYKLLASNHLKKKDKLSACLPRTQNIIQ